MLRKSLLVLSILCAAILIGCSKTEMSNSNTTADNSNKSATGTTGTTSTSGTSTSGTSTSGTSTSGTSTAGTTTSSGEKIGIPECDDFLTKYEACVSNKVPEAARAQYQTGLKQWRDSWKKMADNPQTKGALAAACKQARDSSEASLKSFGCTF